MIKSCLTSDRAFTASSSIPLIYIQQLWDTVRYDKIAGCYKCQLDEQWFDLTKDTLRDALLITPVDNNNAFSSPPTPDALINFVNDLGYPKVVRTLSNVVTNDMFQLWRALTTIINLCLTRKTSGFERPRAPVLQILWGKKKATLIVILSVRFTKLIIYYLQSKHKFHPRPDSPFHLPIEEPGLGYLKFGAMETKREPAKTTKKSKPSACKTDLRQPVTKPALSQQPKPKPAPAKSQEKKRKLVMEMSDKPSLAKRSKSGLVTKQCKPTSSLRSVDESVNEGIPDKEPRFDDEEVDIQREVEESLKSVHDALWCPLPPVIIREPDSRKFQPLPEVQGKGKEKVSDEQISRDLLILQTPKKVSPVKQYLFYMRTPASTEPSGHAESPIIYAALGLTDSDSESDEEVPYVVEVEAQDEGQAGPNPGVPTEGQTRSDPGDDVEPQPQSSHIVHARPNLKHMDLEATDVSTHLHPKLDSPNVHRPLQATATKTITTTTTTTTHPPPSKPQQSTTYSMLRKRIGELEQIMANLIQDNKHLEERVDSHRERLYTLENLNIPQQVSKAVDEIVTDVVDWGIQDPLWNCFKDMPEADMKEILYQPIWETNSYKAHEHQMMLYKALEKSMNHDHTDELLKDLAEARRKKKKRHDSLKTPPRSPPHQPPPPSPPAGPSGTLGSPGASGLSQVTPPAPPPLSTNQEGQSHGSTAPSSSKTAASAKYIAWTTIDTRLRPSVLSIPEDLHMDDDMAPDA
uniref:Monodehydroascorbate reductase n=1 Tax=Tanacetum cinerariifolium TaxID=118510 RepID=A0A6L2LNP9_TANCI|nr:hypothetical protein [Tanacetum cinerariifolium]